MLLFNKIIENVPSHGTPRKVTDKYFHTRHVSRKKITSATFLGTPCDKDIKNDRTASDKEIS